MAMWPPSPAVGFHFPSRHFESAKHLCDCWLHLSDYSHELDLSAISQAVNSRVLWTSHGPPTHPPVKMQPLASRLFCCLPLALSKCHWALTLPSNSSSQSAGDSLLCSLLVSEHKYFPRVSICCLPGQIINTRKLLKHFIWISWNRLDPIRTMWVARNVNTAKT